MDFITQNILWISGIAVFFIFFGIGFFADKRQQKLKKIKEEKLLNQEKYDMTIDIEKELQKEDGILKHAKSKKNEVNVVKQENIANAEIQEVQVQEQENILLNAISRANSLLSETQVNNNFEYTPNTNILKETIDNNVKPIQVNNTNQHFNNQAFVNNQNLKKEQLITNINDIKQSAAELENDLYTAKSSISSINLENLELTQEMSNLDKNIEEILSVTQDLTNLFQNDSEIKTARINFNEEKFDGNFNEKSTSKIEQID